MYPTPGVESAAELGLEIGGEGAAPGSFGTGGIASGETRPSPGWEPRGPPRDWAESGLGPPLVPIP